MNIMFIKQAMEIRTDEANILKFLLSSSNSFSFIQPKINSKEGIRCTTIPPVIINLVISDEIYGVMSSKRILPLVNENITENINTAIADVRFKMANASSVIIFRYQ